jgi:asparagine synthase (glutamine-hydrolysing)
MSGFTGIIHLDGAPADPDLLEKMTRLAERHGGDANNTWCESNVGFGHSLLKTTPESLHEQQPYSFDRNIWIVGDVRVDEREQLVSALLDKGRQASLSQPDIELVLHAFHAWGEQCIEHFYGDFAFAIWDKEKRSLFCARVSFGVKPFYYAHTGSTFVFSNNLDSVRACPGISNELNDAAIGDYLAFGYNLDEKATFFRDIARLAPAHTLGLDQSNKLNIRHYQRLILTNRIHYKNPNDYNEHFLELFKQSVSDRLRTDRVGIELSGGLDSTSVASMAALLGKEIANFSCLGVTTSNSTGDPEDQEAHFAAMVAAGLGMEHETVEASTKSDFYAHCNTPQPFPSPFMAISIRFSALIRTHGPVMLSGSAGVCVANARHRTICQSKYCSRRVLPRQISQVNSKFIRPSVAISAPTAIRVESVFTRSWVFPRKWGA